MNKFTHFLSFMIVMLVCGNVRANDIVIDTKGGWYENSFNGISSTGPHNVKFSQRNFAAGKWDCFILPFSVTKEQMDGAFGNDNYEIRALTKVNGTAFTFAKQDVGSLQINEPYLIRVTQQVADPVFSNVTFKQLTDARDGFINHSLTTESDRVQFRGFYYHKYLSDLNLNYSSNVTTFVIGTDDSGNPTIVSNSSDLNGFNAYFYVDNNSTPTISDGETGGGEEGQGGGTGEGGEDKPSTKTLAQRILEKEQLSDLPTIYLTIPDIGDENNTTDNDLKNKLFKNQSDLSDAAYHRASIIIVDNSATKNIAITEPETGLQVKVRGNATSSLDKRPYRLKFDKDERDPITNKKTGVSHKHDLIGTAKAKRSWALLANAYDRSQIRNALTYHLGQYVGLPFTARYRFVDLVINGNYRGTYQVSDHMEVGSERVDIDEDTGWFIEFNGTQKQLEYPYVPANQCSAVNIKNPDIDDDEYYDDFLKQGLSEEEAMAKSKEQADKENEELIKQIQEWNYAFKAASNQDGNFASPSVGYRSFVDEQDLINFYIATEITGNYDGMMSIYGYRETTGNDQKLHFGPLWDYDLAYENHSGYATTLVCDIDNSGQLKYYFQTYWKDPWFAQRVYTRYQELVKDGILDKLLADIDALAAIVNSENSSVALNYGKWNINGSPEGGAIDVLAYDNYNAYIQQIKDFLKARIEWLGTEFKQRLEAVQTKKFETDQTYNTAQTSSSFAWEAKNKFIDVTVTNRTIKGGVWTSLCLPFDATEAQIKQAFGNRTFKLAEFAGVSDGIMQFSLVKDGNVTSGKPYLLKIEDESASISDFKFSNVFLSSYDNSANGIVSYGDYSFCCTLFQNNSMKTDGTTKLIAEDGSLSDNSQSTLNGSQAYFLVPASPTNIYIEGESTLPPTGRIQLTDVPTIYIDTEKKEDGAFTEIQPSSGNYVSAGIEVIDGGKTLEAFKEELRTVLVDGEATPVLSIRGRGTASWTGTQKKSYRLKFSKKDDDKKTYKYDLTGRGEVKRNWVLLACAGDKSLMRNALAKELGDQLGMAFTPTYCFVDLVLNGVNQGTYMVTDYVEADAARVNVNEDYGWLFEMDNEEEIDKEGDVYLQGSTTQPWLNIKNPEPKETGKKAGTKEEVTNNAKAYFDAFWASEDGNLYDVPSLVQWYIASEIMAGYESLASIFAYCDATAKGVPTAPLCFGPLWSNDASFDNSAAQEMSADGLMADKDTEGSYQGLIYNSAKDAAWKVKLTSLWQQNWFKSAVLAKWKAVYNEGDNDLQAALLAKVTALETALAKTQALNYSSAEGGAGWTLTGAGIANVTKNTSFSTYAEAVEQLRTFLNARFPYLDKKFRKLAGQTVVEFDVKNAKSLTDIQFYKGQTVDVKIVNRGTLSTGIINTLCLPFDMTEAQMASAFGSDAQLEEFQSVTISDDKTIFHFDKPSTTAIQAGKGYIIQVSSPFAFDGYTFSNVTIPANGVEELADTDSDSGDYSYQGILVPRELTNDGTNRFLYGKDKLVYNTTKGYRMPGGRGFFVLPSNARSKEFLFSSEPADPGAATGISQTVMTSAPTKVYNLNGQQINTGTYNLPRGIYIVNGKKWTK